MKAHSYSRFVLGSVALLAAFGCQTDVPCLTRTQRQAIIGAANQAVHNHMTSGPIEQRGTEIPKALWGQAIERLRPLRVVDDRVNVFIVMTEDETEFRLPPRRNERRLPVILSIEDPLRLINAPDLIKHRAILHTIYGGGLRLGEACRLKIADIDSAHMRIRVEQGKGHKDRYTLLLKSTLKFLRE